MNTQKRFSEIEDKELRGDRFEGSRMILQPKDVGEMFLGAPDGTRIMFPQDEFVSPVVLEGVNQKPIIFFASIRYHVPPTFSRLTPECRNLVTP